MEQRLRQIAPPAVLLVAWLVMRSGPGAARVFLTMWVHELGHAVTAWLCGFAALPGPWVTRYGDGRHPLVGILVACGLGSLGARLWRAGRRGAAAGAAALLLLQALLTLAIRPFEARALITFGGDGGLFVLGTALMLTFWAPPGTALHRNRLRWGFLVIGAFAFMDGNHTWWSARQDPGAIMYGELETVGDTDPSRLTGEFLWTERRMVSRYVTLSVLCWLVLAGVYAWGALTRPRPVPDAT
jgi:hypothetical protein